MGRCTAGPRVFPAQPSDPRPITIFAVGGTVLYGRFPLVTSRPWSDQPIVPEVIFMGSKMVPRRPFAKDTYQTLPLEAA